ncbi:MAG: ABC transporter permease [Acidobacteria bacterium]|nr:ABC transporter permease [Acidobacteriota bacterium]
MPSKHWPHTPAPAPHSSVTALFQMLRVQPVLGRALTPADSAPGAPHVVVLGADFWRSEFAGRPDAVGQTVTIDGVLTAIVGVLPTASNFHRARVRSGSL